MNSKADGTAQLHCSGTSTMFNSASIKMPGKPLDADGFHEFNID